MVEPGSHWEGLIVSISWISQDSPANGCDFRIDRRSPIRPFPIGIEDLEQEQDARLAMTGGLMKRADGRYSDSVKADVHWRMSPLHNRDLPCHHCCFD